MTFFVIGAGPGKGADLGGLEGADAFCLQLAQRHGAGGKTWRAYLSTQAADGKPAVNARDRIGNGPWQNFKGETVAKSVDDLHSDNNALAMNTSLTQRSLIIPGVGFAPNRHDVLTGSTPEGRAFPPGEDRTCRNWTSSTQGAAMLGHIDRLRRPVGGPASVSKGALACKEAAQTARVKSQFDIMPDLGKVVRRRDFITLLGGAGAACTGRRSDRTISRFIGESYG